MNESDHPQTATQQGRTAPSSPAQGMPGSQRTNGGEPQYGQYAQPEYGAMAGQFGANYNPYIYGAPDAQNKDQSAGQPPVTGVGPQQSGNAQYVGSGSNPNQQPYGQFGQQNYGNPFGWQNPANQMNGQHGQPRYFNGINLDDPQSNPLYGHWDAYAIIAFVLALLFPVPVLSALLGFAAMWRTKTFHMKGYGFAVAAVVLNVIYTIAVIWMTINGVDPSALINSMLATLQGGGSSSGGDSISA